MKTIRIVGGAPWPSAGLSRTSLHPANRFLWGCLYWVVGEEAVALTPWAYVAGSIISLAVFARNRNFAFLRTSQFLTLWNPMWPIAARPMAASIRDPRDMLDQLVANMEMSISNGRISEQQLATLPAMLISLQVARVH
jgi:hypothetical protein